MNLQRGINKGIGWTDATWNPVTGCLSTKEQCAVRDVCYARGISERFGRSFEPTFHPERLGEPAKLKKPAKIFVCSMGELFGPWVPREWQERILKVVVDNPQHTFQFLTKFPYGYAPLFVKGWPENVWLGTTVTGIGDDKWIIHRLFYDVADATVKFVSLEPFLAPISPEWIRDMDWLIIGAQTKPNKQPKDEWIKALLGPYSPPIFMKKELDYEPKRREFPGGKE